MKLKELKPPLSEMAFKTGISLSHTKEQLNSTEHAFKSHGKLIYEIEGNKFKLYSLNDNIGIFTSKMEFVGWIQYAEFKEFIELKKIYVIEKFRGNKISKLLLFWLKNYLSKSVIIGGAIFTDGERFLEALERDCRFELYIYNSRDNSICTFAQNLLWKKGAYCLIAHEDDISPVYEDSVPGIGTRFVCLEFFADDV